MRAVFQGKQRMAPLPGDLCFYSWSTQALTCHSTPTFRVPPVPLLCVHADWAALSWDVHKAVRSPSPATQALPLCCTSEL